jgi:hypothetical protein
MRRAILCKVLLQECGKLPLETFGITTNDCFIHAREARDPAINEIFLYPAVPLRGDFPIWDPKNIFRLSQHKKKGKKKVEHIPHPGSQRSQ